MGMNADPFGAQAPSEIAADGGRHHCDDAKVYAGANIECGGGDPEFAQGETADNPIPAPNASSTSVKAAEATPPLRLQPMKWHGLEPLQPPRFEMEARRLPFQLSRLQFQIQIRGLTYQPWRLSGLVGALTAIKSKDLAPALERAPRRGHPRRSNRATRQKHRSDLFDEAMPLNSRAEFSGPGLGARGSEK